jgi:hypothetical protein
MTRSLNLWLTTARGSCHEIAYAVRKPGHPIDQSMPDFHGA